MIALVSVTCPVGKKLFPALARAEERARGLGLGFAHVGVQGLDSAADLSAHRERHGLVAPVLQDTDGALAAALDARTTTEVFVIDARGTLRYRGAVNDQYGIGFELPKASHDFLGEAMAAVAAGREVEVPATWAPGCAVEPPASAAPDDGEVTYTRDIARLMARSCVECHRDGGVAPFALETYRSVSARASMLLGVIDEGLMPPWFAAHEGDTPGPFANDRSLLPGERDLLSRWIEAGKPEGDPADAPLPRVHAEEGWVLGEPDAVYEMPRPFTVPAEGRVPYKYFAVPTELEEDRWVSGIEVRPGAMGVVHHVLAYPLPPEAFKNGRLTRWDLIDERRGFFAAWAPGAEPAAYPEGTARLLPAGTVLMLELHYTPDGTERVDRSAIGVHFASEDPGWRPQRVVRTAGISNRGFRIPPGAAAHGTGSVGVATQDLLVTSFFPHMHLRGRSFRFEHVAGEGARATVLDVPRYDFNWQIAYELAKPLRVAAGERIDVHAVFDNSEDNLANPDPSRAVGWGLETDDEMLIGFVNYVLVEEGPALAAGEPHFVVLEPRVQRFLQRAAAAGGGVIPRSKLPRGSRASFDRLDLDGNGVLDEKELSILGEVVTPR